MGEILADIRKILVAKLSGAPVLPHHMDDTPPPEDKQQPIVKCTSFLNFISCTFVGLLSSAVFTMFDNKMCCLYVLHGSITIIHHMVCVYMFTC